MGDRIILAVDPDSTNPGFAVGGSEGVLEVWGGGSGKGNRCLTFADLCGAVLRWARVSGQPPLEVVVEDPLPYKQRRVPLRDLQQMYRCRYMVEAACELHQIPFRSVSPLDWQKHFLEGWPIAKGEGAWKKAYRAKAKSQWPLLAKNEDQCAALGILDWALRGVAGSEPVERRRSRRATRRKSG